MLSRGDVLATLDVTERLNLADLLTAENELEKADSILAKVATDASDRTTRVRFASLLVRNGKYARAQEVLDRLIQDFPDDREVLLRLAQCHLGSKDFANALARFTDLVTAGPDPDTKQDPLANVDVWRGYVDAAARVACESLCAYRGRKIGAEFTEAQRDAIFRAHEYLPAVRDEVADLHKVEMGRLTAAGEESDSTLAARRKELQGRQSAHLKGVAESTGRLGLLLALLGDWEKSREAFDEALRIDRQNREVWHRYAQALTALGDDLRAKAVYDWLLADPVQRPVMPAGFNGPQ
jgi:tetratricopeptide (TPR) repeat protein